MPSAKQAAERAIEQGIEQSRDVALTFVQRYLTRQLEMLSEDFAESLQALNFEALTELSDILFDLETPVDVEACLARLLTQQDKDKTSDL